MTFNRQSFLYTSNTKFKRELLSSFWDVEMSKHLVIMRTFCTLRVNNAYYNNVIVKIMIMYRGVKLKLHRLINYGTW
jgi:hypothetical protein